MDGRSFPGSRKWHRLVVLTIVGLAACEDATPKPEPTGDAGVGPVEDAGTDAGHLDAGAVDYATRCARADQAAGITRPEGWTARTHCKLAPADVESMFPSDRVAKLVIRMTAAEYAAMQADLENLAGGGDPGDGGTWPDPPDAGAFDGGSIPDPPVDPGVASCIGKALEDVCEVDFGDGAQPGKCLTPSWSPDVLTCYPDSFRSPPSWVSACAGKTEGEACATSEHTGTCWNDGLEMACFPDDPGPGTPEDPCKDKADGAACSHHEGAAGTCQRTTGPRICQVDGFDPANVDDVPIEAAAAFWPREPRYFHATLELHGARYTSVGIRYKGNNGLASSIGEKKPLRLKFDHWEDEDEAITDQRAFGFQDLSLSPNQTDPSNLRQVLAAETFRAEGVPAFHAGFVEVSLDTGDGPRLLGLYAMSEFPDDRLPERVFGNDDGQLYKPDGRGAHFLSFIAESMHARGDSDYADVKAFVAALHGAQADRSAYREGLRKRFDMDGFARFYAANQAIGNWDTYGGLAHNFYFYRDTAHDRLVFLPWDFDLAFSSGSDLSLRSYDGRWPLLQAVARDVEFATIYHEALVAYAEHQLTSGKLARRVDALATLIRPAVMRENAVRPEVLEAFEAAVPELKSLLTEQATAIGAYLGGQTDRKRPAHVQALVRRRILRGPHAAERLRRLQQTRADQPHRPR